MTEDTFLEGGKQAPAGPDTPPAGKGTPPNKEEKPPEEKPPESPEWVAPKYRGAKNPVEEQAKAYPEAEKAKTRAEMGLKGAEAENLRLRSIKQEPELPATPDPILLEKLDSDDPKVKASAITSLIEGAVLKAVNGIETKQEARKAAEDLVNDIADKNPELKNYKRLIKETLKDNFLKGLPIQEAIDGAIADSKAFLNRVRTETGEEPPKGDAPKPPHSEGPPSPDEPSGAVPFTRKQIHDMSLEEYTKNEKEIDRQMRKGLIK